MSEMLYRGHMEMLANDPRHTKAIVWALSEIDEVNRLRGYLALAEAARHALECERDEIAFSLETAHRRINAMEVLNSNQRVMLERARAEGGGEAGWLQEERR